MCVFQLSPSSLLFILNFNVVFRTCSAPPAFLFRGPVCKWNGIYSRIFDVDFNVLVEKPPNNGRRPQTPSRFHPRVHTHNDNSNNNKKMYFRPFAAYASMGYVPMCHNVVEILTWKTFLLPSKTSDASFRYENAC